jgi:hypothetical protein
MWSGLFWMGLTDGSPDLIGFQTSRERLIHALAA